MLPRCYGMHENSGYERKEVILEVSERLLILEISGRLLILEVPERLLILKVSGRLLILEVSGRLLISEVSGRLLISEVSGRLLILKVSGYFRKLKRLLHNCVEYNFVPLQCILIFSFVISVIVMSHKNQRTKHSFLYNGMGINK